MATTITYMSKKISNYQDIPTVLGVGSIIEHSKQNDTIWMSGLLNTDKIDPKQNFSKLNLDIRGVRGPKTREVL